MSHVVGSSKQGSLAAGNRWQTALACDGGCCGGAGNQWCAGVAGGLRRHGLHAQRAAGGSRMKGTRQAGSAGIKRTRIEHS